MYLRSPDENLYSEEGSNQVKTHSSCQSTKLPRHHTARALYNMCLYWRIESLCGHSTLLAGPSCYLIYEQLQRINDPAEQARYYIPFEIPDQCLPNQQNVRRRYVNDYCSWECRNNGLYADRRCGTHDARIGVGWRY
jgi:hypothetical protein